MNQKSAITSRLRQARLTASAFGRCVRGGFGLTTGLMFPALVAISFGAVEVASLGAERALLQEAADAAALTGVRELSVAGAEGVEERAEGYAIARLHKLAGRATVGAQATASANTLRVVVTSNRQSFFGNMFPPGGFNSRAEATAAAGGSLPLCVLNLYAGKDTANLQLRGSGLTANGCVVHSNNSIYLDSTSSLTAGRNQAVTAAYGNILPAAVVPSALLRDPLADRTIPTHTCRGDEIEVKYEVDTYVEAGVHCGGIVVDKTATVTFAPGVHFFAEGHDRNGGGDLKLRADAKVKGENIVLVFGEGTTIKAQDRAEINLGGIQSGPLAGMVIVGTRNNTEWMTLNSSNAKRIEGVIYLPAAALTATGNHEIAQDSDWTVTVALGIGLTQGARLKINHRYAESTVPAPSFVGGAGDVRLLD